MTKPQNDCASSDDSDQPGHPSSLIRVFAVLMNLPNAQADLSLRLAHGHFVGFVMRRLISMLEIAYKAYVRSFKFGVGESEALDRDRQFVVVLYYSILF